MLLPDLLCKPDENSFRTSDVAEPVRVLVLDHFADELGAKLAKPGEHIVDVLDGEHDAEISERIHRSAAVIRDHRGREEPRKFEPPVTVRCPHHGNLDTHVAQPSDAICPTSFDRGASLELEAQFSEERDGRIDVLHHDAHVVHALQCHEVPLEICGSSDGLPSATRQPPASTSVSTAMLEVGAASASFLGGRALDRAVGAKHAAISCFRSQQSLAALAPMEVQT